MSIAQEPNMNFLGVDIGCSSVKYGLVSLGEETKVLNFDMIVISQISRVEKYSAALKFILQRNFPYHAAGFGFPSVVRGSTIIRKDIDFNEVWSIVEGILNIKNTPFYAINDADAAGIAEVYRMEAAELRKGVTIVLTLGTGIGSAIFMDGKWLPNTELGQIEMHGMKAQQYTAPAVKTKESLSVQKWASRLQEYLDKVEILLSPDHLILGGGISVDFGVYQSLLKTHAPLQAAYYRNQAGVVGTAIYAAYQTHYYD
jgi:polyphosphate glucokinase